MDQDAHQAKSDPRTYQGEPLLAASSYLRRLPYILDAAQRLRLEALVISADTLTHAFKLMHAIALAVGPSVDRISGEARTAAISSAWQQVDHLHLVRQLLSGLSPQLDAETQAYLAMSEPATALRNDMDHINQKIGNLIARKTSFHPLFGSLAYVVLAPAKEPSAVPHIYTALLMAGTAGRGEVVPVMNPAGKAMVAPVDHFQLSAFDTTLDLSTSLAELKITLARIEKDIESQLRDYATKMAANTGKTIDELLAHPASGISIALKLEVPKTPQGQSTE